MPHLFFNGGNIAHMSASSFPDLNFIQNKCTFWLKYKCSFKVRFIANFAIFHKKSSFFNHNLWWKFGCDISGGIRVTN